MTSSLELRVGPLPSFVDEEGSGPGVGIDGDLGDPLLQWKDLTYTVGDGAKKILTACTGSVHAGEVCAILGPSGSGKTTLLDVVSGRVDKSRKGRSVTGEIVAHPDARTRYVQQEDSLCGILSVRETLVFAQRLAGAPATRVDELLNELGLSVCADTHVGTIFFKGISGGQKRRLSIGVELVSNPSLLLLDEPTSGLDSASALHVIQLLRSVARTKGIAVAMTIHQPSHEAWKLLDTVSFMSSGQLVYFGAPSEPLFGFLSSAGYPVPPNANVADFVLTLINRDFEAVGVKTADVNALVAAFAALSTQGTSRSGGGFLASGALAVAPPQRASWMSRLLILAGRDAREVVRDPGILFVRVAMYIMLSILIALMFFDIEADKSDSAIIARVSVLFFVAAFMVFMAVAVLPFFVMQRPIFVKERCNNAYGVPEYVLSKFITSLPGLALLAGASGLIIVLPSGLNGLGIYIADLFLSLLWAEAFMCFMAALVPHYIIGIALAAGCFGFCMLCEGFFKLKDDIPDYLVWGYHMAPHTYTFRVFMHNEFHPIKNLKSSQFADGTDVLEFYSMDDVDVVSDLMVLLAVAIGIQLAFGAVLQLFHTGKR
mmetsp:Transcript_6200/g.14571  ORF Transcript_6200/g.14571 Transcript_6200/m.14571 type:complete len:601 (-) Transcript_6200:406-2208(-)|eukprot:CAMPEP_0182567190 /NCGR_PEP_ID=MMETSP1324-20130603/8473_1 /TAXON_ID=236786 /ORGANISM="Florenciella sp., Strain RCC1587" /LENGTH=600 /DNA_ID=CAMNT_0024781139 /DNA_START=223 /DNA_END=2025 /DNA_ORIENTATION=-